MEKDQDNTSDSPSAASSHPAISFHRSRLRLDLFAAGAGLLAIPAALLVARFGFFGLNLGMIVLSALAGLASLAAFLGTLTDDRNLPTELAPARGARAGLRAGLLTLILGGGTFILLSTLVSVGLSGSTVLAIPAAAVLLPVLCLMILPILLASMGFGWIGGWMESNGRTTALAEDAEQDSPAEPDEPERAPEWWKTALPYVLIVSGLCYASPLISALVPEKQPVADEAPLPDPEDHPEPTPEELPMPEFVGPPEPPPPSYRYERPVGFLDAGATRVTIIHEEELHDVLTDAPVAVSPDSQFLAFCDNRFGQLSVDVIRLDDRQQVASVDLDTPPIGLAWAQDSKRLVYLQPGAPRYAGVLFIDDDRAVKLPIPNGERLPSQADLVWPFDEEVVIIAPDYAPAYLDLDTLRVHALANSESWSALTVERKDDYFAMARGQYYSNNRWLAAPIEYPTYYKPPNHFLANWIQRTRQQMSVYDQEFAYARLISMSLPQEGDQFIASPDRSVFVHFHDDKADFSYFGLRDEPDLRSSVALSDLFPGGSPPQQALDHLRTKTLAALVCPPIINPLNNKVVGPDRRRIRGMVRMAMLAEDQVEFWIAEEYEPLKKGDVVADLHYWDNNLPHPFEDPNLEDWWKEMPPASPLEPGLVALRSDTPTRLANKVTAWLTRGEQLPEPPALDKDAPPEDLIRQFIKNHHLKATRRDLNGYAADYAPKTDYLDHAEVTPAFIREDQRKYQAKYSKKVEETVRGPIEVQHIKDNFYGARYKLHSSVAGEKPWDWMEADSSVILGIALLDDTPVIISQQSSLIDVQHGEP